MEAPRIVYRVARWGDGVVLEDLAVSDHRAWALAVGFSAQLTLEGAVGMMRKNINALLSYQARAVRDGPAFLAPIKLDDIERLGGSDASTVSRVLNGAVVEFDGERFDANFLVSPQALDDVALSGIQLRAMCVAARGVLGDVSDQKVSDALGRIGVPVARRTVNKYTKDEASVVMPTRHYAVQLEALIASAHDEAGLARLVRTMTEHSEEQRRQLSEAAAPALQPQVSDAANPALRRRTDMREWLLSSRLLGTNKAQFAALAAADQLLSLIHI